MLEPDLQYLKIYLTVFGDKGYFKNYLVKMKSLGWTLFQLDCYSYEKRLGHRHTLKEDP